jgi:hypothetical protein
LVKRTHSGGPNQVIYFLILSYFEAPQHYEQLTFSN